MPDSTIYASISSAEVKIRAKINKASRRKYHAELIGDSKQRIEAIRDLKNAMAELHAIAAVPVIWNPVLK